VAGAGIIRLLLLFRVRMNPQNLAIDPQEVSHIHIVRPSRRRPKPIEAVRADESGETEQAEQAA
jgi:hypothetical protein